MRLFPKRSSDNPKSTESEQPWVVEMAAPIAGLGIKLQRAFAGYMSRMTGRLSLKSLQTALVVFCLLGGSFSGYLVVRAIAGPNGGTTPLTVEAVQAPKHVGKGPEGSVGSNPFEAIHLARKIRAFRRYIDSLRKSGTPHYDSILTHRPGLMDSLGKIEKWYQSQPIK